MFQVGMAVRGRDFELTKLSSLDSHFDPMECANEHQKKTWRGRFSDDEYLADNSVANPSCTCQARCFARLDVDTILPIRRA